MLVDAVALDSYAQRLRWKWTNLARAPRISAALRLYARPKKRHVNLTFDEGQYTQVVVQEDQHPLALINNDSQLR